MRNSFGVLFLGMTLLVLSCGKKENTSGTSSSTQMFGSDYSVKTVEGLFDPAAQAYPIEVAGVAYQISPQTNVNVIRDAIRQAQINQTQPVNSNGVLKFRARITASLYNSGTSSIYYPGQPQPTVATQQQRALTVTAIQFY